MISLIKEENNTFAENEKVAEDIAKQLTQLSSKNFIKYYMIIVILLQFLLVF
jgi:hypothetical protein